MRQLVNSGERKLRRFLFIFRIRQVVVLTVLYTVVQGQLQGYEIDDETVTKIHNYNLCCQCFGDEFAEAWGKQQMAAMKKCGVSAPVLAAGSLPYPINAAFLRSPLYSYQPQPYVWNNQYQYGRKKREAEVSAEALSNLYDAWGTKLGNLSCVLQELGALDAAGEINKAMFSPSSIQQRFGNSKAGSDPVFLQKLSSEMNTCYDISQSFPQSAFNKNDFKQQYGRRMVFFHCCMKAERYLCMKNLMSNHLEKMTGKVPSSPFTTDKYDAAAMSVKAMKHSASPEAKFIDVFFWGDSKL